jgi:glycosyltransferase involved in cell wall biosynthesis
MREVPELAARLYLGARATPNGAGWDIELDGHRSSVSEEVFAHAKEAARFLQIRPRDIQYASDVLQLRHDAEDFFLERLVGRKDIPQVLFVPAGDMASAYYRARIPADVLHDRGLAISHITMKLDLSKAVKYQVLWVQLVTAPILIAICEEAKKAGVKIVYDFDDRFDCIPPENPAAAVYVEQKQREVWDMIELADVVTVSTRDLARRVQGRAKDVRVLPNHIPASIWPRRNEPDPEITRILWAGSPTHRRDLAVAAPAIARVLERHKGKVRFVCFGEKIPEALAGAGAHVDLMDFVDFTEYADALAKVRADVAIAPLEANEFNAGKSAVKVLEYGAAGYATFCSPVGEYPEVKEDGAPIGLVEDHQWEDVLEFAITNKGLMADIGQKLRSWVIPNRCIVKKQASPWLEVARDLVATKVKV